MPWGTTKCEAVDGWQGRITTKVAISAFTGIAVGVTLATLHSTPVLRSTLLSTASFLLLMGCFAGAQETTRLMRCTDSPANSAVAGGVTGALLFKAHGRHAFPGIVTCAALGASGHWASDQLGQRGGVQGLLITLGLLDTLTGYEQAAPEPVAPLVEEPEREQRPPSALWRLLDRLNPVTKLTDEEWEEHEQEKRRKMERRMNPPKKEE